eukprot:scaffold1273_cov401-Prasinococcus_capsulatus_cf.AAC.5
MVLGVRWVALRLRLPGAGDGDSLDVEGEEALAFAPSARLIPTLAIVLRHAASHHLVSGEESPYLQWMHAEAISFRQPNRVAQWPGVFWAAPGHRRVRTGWCGAGAPPVPPAHLHRHAGRLRRCRVPPGCGGSGGPECEHALVVAGRCGSGRHCRRRNASGMRTLPPPQGSAAAAWARSARRSAHR